MQNQAQQILDRCNQVIAKAKELYGLDMSGVQIRFDLRGRAAGQAYRRGFQYGVRFNRDMLTREAFDHVLNNTVPHEFAHIACFMNPSLGRNHDRGWERVCVALGGSGATRHQEDVVMGKGTTYEYHTANGNTVRIGDRHHRYVQSGGTLTFRKGKGTINQFCTYSIVGVNGRTLANPIVKQSLSKEVPTQALIPSGVTSAQATHVAGSVIAHTQGPVNQVQRSPVLSEPKAVTARRIMMSGYNQKKSYPEIIEAMAAGSGYTIQLARACFKDHAKKIGIPETFYR